MSEESNEDVLDQPIIPLICQSIMTEKKPSKLYVVEMKVNPIEVLSDHTDGESDLLKTYDKTDRLIHDIVFNLFQYRENNTFTDLPLEKLTFMFF